MITLYGFKTIFEGGVGETKDLRAQWALEETGLPYRVHGECQIFCVNRPAEVGA
jgi:hypothetical protein